MLNSIVFKEMQIKTTVRYYYIANDEASKMEWLRPKRLKIPRAGQDALPVAM